MNLDCPPAETQDCITGVDIDVSVPPSLGAALDALQEDQDFIAAFSPEYVEGFLAVKRASGRDSSHRPQTESWTNISGTTSPRPRAAPTKPRWLAWASYPFEVRTLRSPKGDIAFIDEGDGPPLLFVHVGMWSFVWRDVIVRLRERYRCIAIDPPGSGLSSAPATGTPSIADAANAVDQVVRHLGLNELALVFHDLGGPASLAPGRRPWSTRSPQSRSPPPYR